MAYIKLFEDWAQSLDEGQIRVFGPGNPFKPEQIAKGKNMADSSLDWKQFYPASQKWLDDKIAVSLVCAEFIPNSDTLGYDKKTTNPKYQSEPNGTWGDKSLPKFMDEHPRYDESEFDLVKVDPSLQNRDGVYVQDKNGNEFCIHASRILDVQKGSSVRDNIAAGSFYFIDGMRARLANYQDGIVTVSFKKDSKDPKDSLTFTLAQWKAKNYLMLDEAQVQEEKEAFLNESSEDNA